MDHGYMLCRTYMSEPLYYDAMNPGPESETRPTLYIRISYPAASGSFYQHF